MFGKSKPRILVAGAGPVGLVTALFLERNGIHTEIVDESWRAGQRSYATALHPDTQELLDELGFLDGLDGHAIDVIAFYRGHELAHELDLGDEDLAHPRILVVSQSRLEEALAKQLRAESRRKVQWNHRVARLAPRDDGVSVTIDRLGRDSAGYGSAHVESSIEKTLEKEYELVVGADGHNSVVRRSLDASWTEVGDPETYAIFEVMAAREPDAKLRVAFCDSMANVLWPITDGRWRWAFQIEPEGKPDVREKARLSFQVDDVELEVGEQRLAKLVAERAPWFDGWADELVWSATIRFERRLAEPFGRGRLWLAGDAAHLTAPIGVQSMNRGLREANELGWRIPRFLDQQRVDVLPEYGAEQTAVWQALQGLDRPLVSAGAPDWLLAEKHRLRNCVPATGATLDRLIGRLGLTAA